MSNWFDPFASGSGSSGGTIKLSTKPGNTLSNEPDGLYSKPFQRTKTAFELIPSVWTADKNFTILDENIKENAIISLGLQDDVTEDQYDKLAAAKIIIKEQFNGGVILKAFGPIPDEAIPMEIIIDNTTISLNMDGVILKDRAVSKYYTLYLDDFRVYLEETIKSDLSVVYDQIVLKDRVTHDDIALYVDNGQLYLGAESTGNYITLDDGTYITLNNGDKITYEVN